MIVRLKPGDASKIQPLAQADGNQMLGVVVSANDAPVSLSDPGAQETFVATYGHYGVLVSDQNGAIKSGDLLVVSSLAGVGMKADATQQTVIGKAMQGFDGKSNVDSTVSLSTSGGTRSVNLGRITVDVAVSHNPLYQKASTPGVPQLLSKLAQSVTSQPVSAFRIYASLAVIIVTLAVAGSVLFAGVRSGMIAIGRNPLAKRSISRNLVQVTLMALIVFVIGVFAVYLLLRV